MSDDSSSWLSTSTPPHSLMGRHIGCVALYSQCVCPQGVLAVG